MVLKTDQKKICGAVRNKTPFLLFLLQSSTESPYDCPYVRTRDVFASLTMREMIKTVATLEERWDSCFVRIKTKLGLLLEEKQCTMKQI